MKIQLSSIAVATMLIVGVVDTSAAQERRRSADGPPPASPTAQPTNPRTPFAGVWEGARIIKDGAEPERNVPTTIVFEADASGSGYSGFQVFPDNRRGPYDGIALSRGTLSWKHSNSGGGSWVYSARLVGTDTLVGTVALKDWPQGNGRAPSGTFKLVRRRPS
jgi:hypothetical protein